MTHREALSLLTYAWDERTRQRACGFEEGVVGVLEDDVDESSLDGEWLDGYRAGVAWARALLAQEDADG